MTPRAATPDELGRLTEALAEAFADDPVMGWLIPSGARRPAALRRFFALELEHVVLPAGQAWTDDDVHGACLELPPGRWRMPLAAQARHAPDFARIFGSRLGHALALITRMERRHLREPHLYVPYVGVAPASQGHGHGTALLGATTARADAEGLPTYLEATSEANARLYARLGFEHLGQLRLGGSPPLWRMRRPPAT